MTILKGGDSAEPQPSQYAGHDIWCWYVAGATPHVWTKEEVAELAAHGIKGTLPIVVPPQDEKWWENNDGYPVLEAFVREALAWGIPNGSPLVLDVEEGQAVQIHGSNTQHAWAVACRTHGLVPWTYSDAVFLLADQWANRWLAHWPEPAPTDPQMPAEMSGWQYASGELSDSSIFESDRDYLTPDLRVVNLGAAAEGVPSAPATPEPSPAAASSPAAPDPVSVAVPANDLAVAEEETQGAAEEEHVDHVAEALKNLEAAVVHLKALTALS